MRETLAVGVLLACLALGAAAGCGRDSEARRRDESAIQRVLRQGQEAVVAGDGRKVCRMLTARGRKLSLRFTPYWDGSSGPTSAPERRPTTCEGIFKGLYQIDRANGLPLALLTELQRGLRFTNIEIEDDRARATANPRGGGESAQVQLRKDPNGRWRVDWTDSLPDGD